MTIPLKPASKAVSNVLDKLITGLAEPGDARKVDNTNGAFMPAHVELVGRSEHGTVYSVAHYFEANGDLVADPDMELLRDRDGNWFPVSITMTLGHRRALLLGDGGKARVDEREYRAELRFLSVWMKNIRQQQGL